MHAEDFIIAKQQSWQRLAALVRDAQSNIVSLHAGELQELGRLYRQITSDLAQARRDYPGHPVTVYLNDLVAQGHSAIYRERSASVNGLKHYFGVLLPQTFRQMLPWTLAAFILFLVPALVGWVLTARDPSAGIALMPRLQPVVEDIRAGHEWWRSINDENAGNAALILTNNISVAFRAFIGGLTLGLFTIFILYQNGLMLGILAGAAQKLGFAGNLWGFIAAHGVMELSIIFLAGGAGLHLGWSILYPGLLTRRAALVAAARRSVVLSGAIVMFLVLAGLIEGFISPSYLPLWVKLAVAVGSGVVMYGYLLLTGRHVPIAELDDDTRSVLRIETA